MLSCYQKYGPGTICPRILLYPEHDTVHCDGAGVHFVGTLALRNGFRPLCEVPEESPTTVGGLISACLLVDRRLALEAGGFEEIYFFYFEDLEFCCKLRIRGQAILCDSSAVVHHDRGEGTPGLAFRGEENYPVRRAYYSMRNRWFTILTYYRLSTLLLLMPVLAAYELATVFLALLRGWMGAWARAWWWILTHRREVRERRRTAQGNRAIDDSELLQGGTIPLAPGLIGSGWVDSLIGFFSTCLNGYWRLARRLMN
jgi:GT2 family glycosyltransferase